MLDFLFCIILASKPWSPSHDQGPKAQLWHCQLTFLYIILGFAKWGPSTFTPGYRATNAAWLHTGLKCYLVAIYDPGCNRVLFYQVWTWNIPFLWEPHQYCVLFPRDKYIVTSILLEMMFWIISYSTRCFFLCILSVLSWASRLNMSLKSYVPQTLRSGPRLTAAVTISALVWMMLQLPVVHTYFDPF